MARLMIVSAGALIDADGRVLMARRPEGKANAGLWEFPGGKLEDGETPEQALVRELKEELDIDTETSCLAPIGFASTDLGDVHLLMPLFVCRKWQGIVRAKVASALTWVRPAQLLELDLVPADRPLAAQLSDLL
ncbi:MAG: (deoxy)nucleoside triphosphate pyrophosphohydrolase [Pseudomonadota bacterium]